MVNAFDKHARLNPEPFSSIDAPRRVNSFIQSRIVPTSAYRNMPTENTLDWYPSRQTEMSAMEVQSIQIDVTGRFNIVCGSISDIYVYSEEVTEKDNMYSVLDTVFSGRYMVMSICHHIDRERHSMSMQLNKDSLMQFSAKDHQNDQ
jgi:hypothetical protein